MFPGPLISYKTLQTYMLYLFLQQRKNVRREFKGKLRKSSITHN